MNCVRRSTPFWASRSSPQLEAREAAGIAPPRPQLPDDTPRRTLLYVEDNPADLELVEQLIARRPDLQLLSAADGSLGIEFARASQPEVILMDINLSGISGIEAMQSLRADRSTAHVPIIALSANAVPHDIERCLQAGFFSYLTKPIKVGQFMDALDAALDFSRTASRRTAKREQA
jgi:CheY-like chemotaxis protein